MGKKGSCVSAIKMCIGKPVNVAAENGTKEKKKGKGILKHEEIKSFVPLFRKPSSIEQILGEADQQKILARPPTPAEQLQTSTLVVPRAASPGVVSPRITSPRAASPSVTSPRAASSSELRDGDEVRYRSERTPRHHLSAIKIQAAYRGYKARRNIEALRGLLRLQGVVQGQNVKQQTTNALKMMQLLVQVQTQIQSRRIQMLEDQALHRQAYKNDKELESSLSNLATVNESEAGLQGQWDDSLLTKEEVEARLQRKMEAIMRREKTMSYGYSNQLWKANPKSAQTSLTDIQGGGFPWRWSWLQRQLPLANPPETQDLKSFHLTPPRKILAQKRSPRPSSSSSYKQNNNGFDDLQALTPRSTRSAIHTTTRSFRTPSSRTTSKSPIRMKYSKPRTGADSAFDMSLKDDDSLMSCPPFSVPNYMSPTVSAKAKARAASNPGDRFPRIPSGDLKRRFSFPLSPNEGSRKGSISQRPFEKHQTLKSTGDLSIDSTVSLSASLGRKPFNRFV